jgi:sodium pump decarboxylase gamma subunit
MENGLSLIELLKDPALIQQMSMGDRVMASLQVTLLGMGITFVALVVLWGVIIVFSKTIVAIENSKNPKVKVVETNIAPALSAATVVSDEEDETELVAVITAAVAASLGTTVHNIVVKNITRVHDATPAWGRMGRTEQMNSRL